MPWTAEYGDRRRHHRYGQKVLRLRSRVQGSFGNQHGSRRAAEAAASVFLTQEPRRKDSQLHSLPWAGKAAFPVIGKYSSTFLLDYRVVISHMHRTLLLLLQICIEIAHDASGLRCVDWYGCEMGFLDQKSIGLSLSYL